MKSIPLYSGTRPTPRQIDTLKEVFNQLGYKTVTYDPLKHKRVLVFGKELPPENGKECVTTYSLSQLMSMPDTVTVLGYALREFEGVSLDVSGYKHTALCLSEEGAVDGLKDFFDVTRPIAVDIETDGNLGTEDTPETVNIIAISFAQDNRVVSVSMFDKNNAPFLVEREAVVMFARWLSTLQAIVAYNGKFDLRVINRYFSLDLSLYFDPMLAHHVLNQAARGRHGLKQVAQNALGAEDWEKEAKDYTKGGGHYELIPQPLLTRYNRYDVIWTLELYKYFKLMLAEDPAAQTAFEFEMLAQSLLMDVEAAGLPISKEGMREVEQQALADKERYLHLLRKLVGANFNPGSPKQVKEWLAQEGVSVSTTAEGYLTDLLDAGNCSPNVKSFLNDLLGYRKAAKVLGTYVKGWQKYENNGRVHPTYLVHGTSTGRLSSSAPNVQNMPRDTFVRKIVGY